MKLNLSLKLRNILLIITFISICFLCDAHFFSDIILTLFPYFTCNFEHTLGYYLYQTSEIYRTVYNHREITTCIFGCLYFLFFRVYVFQKWVSIIENKCQGLFLHDFLKELRKNKQILLYANILFLLLTVVVSDFCSSALEINYLFSFIFVLPFNYLILYLRWAIKDKNLKNNNGISNKYHLIQYVNYIFLANFIVIMGSSFFILLTLFSNTVYPLYRIICFILILMGIYFVLYSLLYHLLYNTKIFIVILFIILCLSILLFYDLKYEIELINNILSFIFSTIYFSFFGIGIMSSLFTNQISKILTDKNINN